PWRTRAVIGYARGDRQQCRDLGGRGAGSDELDRLEGAPGAQQFKGVGHRARIVGDLTGWISVAHALAYRSRCDKRRRWLEFAAISAEKCSLMRIAATSAGGARVVLAVGFWLSV